MKIQSLKCACDLRVITSPSSTVGSDRPEDSEFAKLLVNISIILESAHLFIIHLLLGSTQHTWIIFKAPIFFSFKTYCNPPFTQYNTYSYSSVQPKSWKRTNASSTVVHQRQPLHCYSSLKNTQHCLPKFSALTSSNQHLPLFWLSQRTVKKKMSLLKIC